MNSLNPGEGCENKPPGNIPDPNDCASFYQCDGQGGGTRITCPPGTLYDASSGVCNWEDQIDPEDLCQSCPNDDRNVSC